MEVIQVKINCRGGSCVRCGYRAAALLIKGKLTRLIRTVPIAGGLTYLEESDVIYIEIKSLTGLEEIKYKYI